MTTTRTQPAARVSFTLLVATWLMFAPALVICTCSAGHAAVAPAVHSGASCDHHCSDASDLHDESSPQSPASSHEDSRHQDTQLSIDVTVGRSTDADGMALPPADLLIAVLPCFELTPHSVQLATPIEYLWRTGPPAPIADALASTILLI